MSTALVGGPRPEQQIARLLKRWRQDPVSFVQHSFSSDPLSSPVHVDPAQKQILEAVRDHDRVAVRTGRGVGKTATAAFLAHWWLGLAARPSGSSPPPAPGATSRTSCGLRSERGAGSGSSPTPSSTRRWGSTTSKRSDSRQGGRDRLRPSGQRRGLPLPQSPLIVDEAKGMPDEIFAALIASLSGDYGPGTQKVVALSTPPLSKVGWFARVSTSRSEWHTIHVSGLDSPRVSRSFVEEIRDEYGEDSPEYEIVRPWGDPGRCGRDRHPVPLGGGRPAPRHRQGGPPPHRCHL